MRYIFLLAGVLAIGISSCGKPAIELPRSATADWPNSTQSHERMHYKLIEPRQSTNTKQDQIEVTEYFWYGCPHCYELEPYLVRWIKDKPQYVTVKRIAVSWDRPDRIAHARLFYALQALGRMDLHEEVFTEIHQRKNQLYVQGDAVSTLNAQRIFAVAHGIDGSAFDAAYAAAASEIKPANESARIARIDGVPSIVVGGRYRTDSGLSGGAENVFPVVNSLVERQRTEMKSMDSH